MSQIQININGQELSGFSGQTILQIAQQHHIDIPTLCHDARVKKYGSCGVCLVELVGSPKLLRACSTDATDGMILQTHSKRANAARRTALELLLSDHEGDCRPPCVLECPAQTDCQGYVGLLALGEFEAAIKLVKDKIPLPGSIGRVCPHPCETGCRRKLVEEPISIAQLKWFLADEDLNSGTPYTLEVGPDTGKRVAVVGGGPGGLTAAYFLRGAGHAVTIFDAMPKMGGMLRYGIPEYRLPKEYLAREIDVIASLGIEMKNNIQIGRDLTLRYLENDYDAVIVAVGAWRSTPLRCPGEELDGVIGGIDFLRDVELQKTSLLGRKIAIVGGGNTAMDACRTAVRLGAEQVYNIYRRTLSEMPAEEIEIREAQEEGVVFLSLRNPIEVLGENGKVRGVQLQVMELGEPDASGRRAPVAVEGKQEFLEVDTILVAIGQKLDATGLSDLDLTKWGTIVADPNTCQTSRPGIFAVGDATNDGADIAITAIGEAKRAAIMVDAYLKGECLEQVNAAPTPAYLVTRENVTAETFADEPKQPREQMAHLLPEQRAGHFLEVNQGYSKEQAMKEAGRCLECGCHDYFECKLITYANEYEVKPTRLAGEVHQRNDKEDHPLIHRNPDKCILCGLCVRICDEVVGATALGFVDRGFDTIIQPALGETLQQTDCVSCGQCVSVCPTGALMERMMVEKQVPTRERQTPSTCAFCGVGCSTTLTSSGGKLLRSLPRAKRAKNALLCMKGRFGFGELQALDRLTTPLYRETDGSLTPLSTATAVMELSKQLGALQSQYGTDAVAMAISDAYTGEQVCLLQAYAKSLGLKQIYSFGVLPNGVAEVLGTADAGPDFDQLRHTDLILLVQCDPAWPHGVLGMNLRRAVSGGTRLITLNGFSSMADELAEASYDPGEDLSLLLEVYHAVLLRQGMTVPDALANGSIRNEAAALAAAYLEAKTAIIVVEQHRVSTEAARLLAQIATAANKVGMPRSGVLLLRSGANTAGLERLGVRPGAELESALEDQTVKGLLLFGEDPTHLDLSGLSYLAMESLSVTQTAEQAQLLLPAQSFAELTGHYCNSVGKLGSLSPAIDSVVAESTFSLLSQAVALTGASLPWHDLADVSRTVRQRWDVQQTPMATQEGQAVDLPAGETPLLRDQVGTTNPVLRSLLQVAEQVGAVK